jgi:hypothetical protein
LVALAQDLETIHALRLPIVPLRSIVDTLLVGNGARGPDVAVAITLDDGLDFDFDELLHPLHGPQTSVHCVLRSFADKHGASVHATSFVIASPDARRQIAHKQMLDHQWIGEHWWAPAVATQLFHVGNHSWDHVSPSVEPVGQRSGKSGSFKLIETFDDADLQVRQAREYIAARVPNPGAALFAFPYGDAAGYVIDEYLPAHGERGGTLAAVTGIPDVLHAGSNRWYLPRYTFGADWQSPEELGRILRS